MTIFLLTALYFVSPDWQLHQAMVLTKQDNFERSEFILKKIDQGTVNRDLYLFYRLLNNFSQNNKSEADFFAEQVNDAKLPVRYMVLTSLMRGNLETWNDGDLDDISRDMRHSTNRIESLQLDKKTILVQNNIISKLNKLIKEAEDEAKNPKSGGQQANSKKVQKPMDESSIQKDSDGKGEVNQVKMRKLQERWNSLPPNERTKSLQSITIGLSPRHREMIESYFIRISK